MPLKLESLLPDRSCISPEILTLLRALRVSVVSVVLVPFIEVVTMFREGAASLTEGSPSRVKLHLLIPPPAAFFVSLIMSPSL